MTKEGKVLVETYKGLEIFLNKHTGRFEATNKATNREYEGTSIWEVQNDYDNDNWQAPKEKYAYIKDDNFVKWDLQKVEIIAVNKVTRQINYNVVDSSQVGDYDIGRSGRHEDMKELYPMNEANNAIFEQLRELEIAKEKLDVQKHTLLDKVSKK